MDILKIINQEQYLKRFGMIMRMLRTKHRYTLRSLASQVGISHAYLRKIEMAQTSINRNVYDRLMSVYNTHITYDQNIEIKFFENWKQFNQSIIYLNRAGMNEAYEKIEEDKAIHARSPWMIEYYIVQLGFHTQNLDKLVMNISQIHDDLSSVENLMDNTTKQIYLLYKGNYYYHMNNAKANKEAFEAIIQLDTWNVYSAMALYLLGLSHTMNFSLKRSNKLLHEAMEMFEQLNIEVRVSTIRVFIELNLMKMGHFENTERIFDFGLHIAKQHALPEFSRLIYYNYAIYFLKNNNPKLALQYLDYIDIKTQQYYLYKAYAYSKMDAQKKVIDIAEESENANIPLTPNNLVYTYGISVLKAYHTQDSKLMKQNVKPFYDECLRLGAYFEIDLAYFYYKNYLTYYRRYKEAYELARQMIALTKDTFN